jgi:hypothetical protein
MWKKIDLVRCVCQSRMPHLCIKYAQLPCEVRNRFRISHSRRFRSNPGGTAEGSFTMSPFTRKFDNHDFFQRSTIRWLPCMGLGSIVHITVLDWRRIWGTTCRWSCRSDLPYEQQFFNSWNSDASRLSLGGAMLLSTSNHSRRGRFDRVCDQVYSERCAIFGRKVNKRYAGCSWRMRSGAPFSAWQCSN